MYEYQARVERIIDADTLDLVVELGFYITTRMRVRVRGIDAPEVRGAERTAGLAATARVHALIPPGTQLLVRTHKIEKFGRFLADVRFVRGCADPTLAALVQQGEDLAELLLAEGHALPYAE